MKLGILFGGGLDSTATAVLLKQAGHQVSLIHMVYGQKAAQAERKAAFDVSLHLGCNLYCNEANIHLTGEQPIMGSAEAIATSQATAKLDGRNLMLLGMAAPTLISAGIEVGVFGLHQEPEGTPMVDALPSFISAVNGMLSRAVSATFRTAAPFSSVPRHELIWTAHTYLPNIFDIAHTCYENVAGGCGQCSHCVQKAQMLNVSLDETKFSADEILALASNI